MVSMDWVRMTAPVYHKDKPIRIVYVANGKWVVQQRVERPDKGSIVRNEKGKDKYADWRELHGWENISEFLSKDDALTAMGFKVPA